MSRSDSTPRRPRIVVASSGLGHVARGIEAWASDLAAALAKRGADVTLCRGAGTATAGYEKVIPCWTRDSARARRAASLLPRALAWRLGIASPYGVEQLTFACGLIRHLRAAQVDLMHVQDPLVALMAERARRLGLIRTRTILAHGTEESPEFLRRLSYIQHLAPFHADQCRDAGVSKPAWTTIPNFVDTARFSPGNSESLRAELGIPRDALVVLTAAAIKRTHKRIDHLLNEFARLRKSHPGLPAYLIVSGGKETETDELVELGKRALGDRVRFLVSFPRERMPELYRAADAFVLTSLKEMMPIALLEATASGLPCLVHDHPVMRWMIGDGGQPIDMTRPGSLAETLACLLADREERETLGPAARNHCLQHFGEGAVVNQITSFYDTLLPAPVRATPPLTATTLQVAEPRSERVSVIIPAFNVGHWVGEAVASVLAQTVAPAEIIVVDDGSTDDTRQRLAPFMSRIRYEYQPNQGVAAARNRGISLASGELIAFLDGDDVWHPCKLELQLAALLARPEIGLLGTDAFDWPDASPPPLFSPPAIDKLPWRSLVVKNRLTTSSVIVRRDVLTQVGTFDPSLRGPEDFDLWLRIAERAQVGKLNAPLVGYRTVEGSLGRQPAAMEQGLRRILGKLDARGVWRTHWLLRRKARSYTDYSCAYLYGASGDQPMALRRLLESLLRYPLPYHAGEVRMPLARPRMLTMILYRLLRGHNSGSRVHHP